MINLDLYINVQSLCNFENIDEILMFYDEIDFIFEYSSITKFANKSLIFTNIWFAGEVLFSFFKNHCINDGLLKNKTYNFILKIQKEIKNEETPFGTTEQLDNIFLELERYEIIFSYRKKLKEQFEHIQHIFSEEDYLKFEEHYKKQIISRIKKLEKKLIQFDTIARIDLKEPEILSPHPHIHFTNGNALYLIDDRVDSINIWKHINENKNGEKSKIIKPICKLIYENGFKLPSDHSI